MKTKTTYLYFYISVSGLRIPGVHYGPRARLNKKFRGSSTPLTEVVKLVDKLDIVRAIYQLQCIVTNGQSGLQWSIDNCIKQLSII